MRSGFILPTAPGVGVSGRPTMQESDCDPPQRQRSSTPRNLRTALPGQLSTSVYFKTVFLRTCTLVCYSKSFLSFIVIPNRFRIVFCSCPLSADSQQKKMQRNIMEPIWSCYLHSEAIPDTHLIYISIQEMYKWPKFSIELHSATSNSSKPLHVLRLEWRQAAPMLEELVNMVDDAAREKRQVGNILLELTAGK